MGIKLVPGGRNTAQVTEVRHRAAGGGPASSSTVPASRALWTADGLRVSAPPGAGGVLVVYIECAASKPVLIDTPGRAPLRFQLETGAMVLNGSLVSTQLAGRHQLIPATLQLSGTPLRAGTPRPVGKAVDLVTLRSHLTHYTAFPPAGKREVPSTVIARLEIGADGVVQAVRCSAPSGAEGIARTIESTILQWRFKPFELDGRASRVTTQLPVLITPEGEIGVCALARSVNSMTPETARNTLDWLVKFAILNYLSAYLPVSTLGHGKVGRPENRFRASSCTRFGACVRAIRSARVSRRLPACGRGRCNRNGS